MKACPRCGEPSAATARFCPACGSSLASPPVVPHEVRKTVTVLFCDVTGSTTLGERQDPEQVRRVLSQLCQEALELFGGRARFAGGRRRYQNQ